MTNIINVIDSPHLLISTLFECHGLAAGVGNLSLFVVKLTSRRPSKCFDLALLLVG